MINFLIALILISASVSISATAQNNSDVAFIGFNGGNYEGDNFSYFEQAVLFFKNNLFKGKGIFLNAAGPESKIVPIDVEEGFVRNWLGDVKLEKSKVPATQVADINTLNSVVNATAKQKPKAVTMLFTDHGDKDKVAAWHSDIPYSTIQNEDDNFSKDTVVRRIHLHCFSGGALRREDKEGPTHPLSLSEYLQKKYPQNRCGFANALEDEVSYGIRTEWNSPQNPLNELLKKGASPSLQDMKDLFQRLEYSVSTPVLTSDYFINDLIKNSCTEYRQFYPALECKACTATKRTKARALTDLVDESLLYKVCGYASNPRQIFESVDKDAQYYSSLENSLTELKYKTADAYLKKKDPQLLEKFKEIRKITDARLACRASSVPCPKVSDSELQGMNEKYIIPFYEKFLSLTAGPQRMRNPKTGIHYTAGGNNQEFKNILDNEFQHSDHLKDFNNVKEIESKPCSFEDAYQYARYKLDVTQSLRKKLWSDLTTENKTVVELWLKQPENESIKELYDNIRRCETTPFNK